MGKKSLESLRRLSNRVSTADLFEPVAMEIVDMFEHDFGFPYGAVLGLDSTAGRLEPIAVCDQGRGPEFRAADKAYVAGHALEIATGVTGWVAAHGRAALIDDTAEDPRYLALRQDIGSELCVPIRVGRRVLGVMNTESPKRSAYRTSDVPVLSAVAALAAMSALDHGDTQQSSSAIARREAFHQEHDRRGLMSAFFDLGDAYPDDGLETLCERLTVLAAAYGSLVRHRWTSLPIVTLIQDVFPGFDPRLIASVARLFVDARRVPAVSLLLHGLTVGESVACELRPAGSGRDTLQCIRHHGDRSGDLTGSRRALVEALAVHELGGSLHSGDPTLVTVPTLMP